MAHTMTNPAIKPQEINGRHERYHAIRTSRDNYNVYVQTLESQLLPLKGSKYMLVTQVKETINAMGGLHPREQRVFHAGLQMTRVIIH